MYDTLTSVNAEDFRQRYRGVYGFLQRQDKDDLLVYIREATSTSVNFEDAQGRTFYANVDMGVMFKFLPIVRGWFATRHGPRYFTRIAERQYHRGISRGNTQVYYKREDGRVALDALRVDVLEDVFSTKLVSTFNDFKSEKIPWFIPNKYFLIDTDLIMMYDRVIGTIQNRQTIFLEDTSFLQEVGDFIHKLNIPMEVKVND